MKKGDLAINSTMLFVLAIIFLLLMTVFYIYLKDTSIDLIKGSLRLPT